MSDDVPVLGHFDVSKIDTRKIVVLVAKRGCGKSTIVKNILYSMSTLDKQPLISVFSGTDRFTQFYADILNRPLIYEEFNKEITRNLMTRQNQLNLANITRRKQGKTPYHPDTMVILDDVLADSHAIFRDTSVKKIFFQGRHSNIGCIFCSQYSMAIPRDMRSNIDYTFLLKENNVGNRRRLYENFASVFPTYEQFCKTFDHYTQHYGAMVIDHTSTSLELEDSVFQFRATMDLPTFVVGC